MAGDYGAGIAGEFISREFCESGEITDAIATVTLVEGNDKELVVVLSLYVENLTAGSALVQFLDLNSLVVVRFTVLTMTTLSLQNLRLFDKPGAKLQIQTLDGTGTCSYNASGHRQAQP